MRHRWGDTCQGPLGGIFPESYPVDHPPTLFLHADKDTTAFVADMLPYAVGLEALGIGTKVVVDPAAAHEWLTVAPTQILDWFSTN